MAFETTTQDRHRWQKETNVALGVMLEHGSKAGLPALTWTVATTGALTGEADVLMKSADEQRAAVQAWAAYLGASVKERTDRDDVVHLHAGFTWHQNDRVKGVLRATLYPKY